jgi:hypothetical protein
MPIVELLKRQSGNPQSFGPDEIKIIVAAFEDTYERSGLWIEKTLQRP